MKQSDYKKRNMEIWNEVAPRYHKRWASEDRGPFASTRKLVNLVGVKNGNTVLDLACGTGVVTKKLIHKVGKTGYVVGADTSVTAIKIAKKWNDSSKSNLHFVNGDAENISFSKKFDIITCQYALFFFPNALKALKNMRKNLKESGRLAMSVHGRKDKVPYFGNILDAVTQFIPEYVPPGTPDLDRFGTKKSFEDIVKKAGFSNVLVKDHTFRHTPGSFENYWKNYLRYVAKPIKRKLDALEKPQKKELKEMVRQNTLPYTKRDGIIDFPWQVLILTAKYQR